MKKAYKSKTKFLITALLVLAMAMVFTACGDDEKEAGGDVKADTENSIIYASNDYTRINPAIDEHGEINLLIFDGLMGHDKDNNVVPALAEKYDLDNDTNTYTFKLRKGVKWHDGEDFTADDVKFTIDQIMDPDNESEIACNYEDVEKITVKDDQTISFKLKEPNVSFLEYMTIGILPKHLLEGKNMQEDGYFKAPVGTGPYKFESWDEGQSIVLKRNDDYWNGKPNIEEIIFKIVPDDNAKALQLESGEVDFSQLTPKDTKKLEGKDGFDVYKMKTSDYRGIMYNFNNPFWKENKELIHAINCAVDRDAMIKSVLLGEGIPAYGPLARNEFNDKNIKQESYDPKKAQKIIEENGR